MHSVVPSLRRIIRVSDRMDDVELLTAFARARDEEAFAVLVRRHGPLVYGVCRRLLRQPADIDDAFQATFLVLVQRADSLAHPDRLSNWLHGVALRTARCLRNRNLRRQLRESAYDLAESPVAGRTHDEELRPLLDEEINRLPRKYRLPVVLCHLRGLTRREAARQLGCPEGTLSVRLARALVVLRRRLMQRGVAPAAATAVIPTLAANVEAVPPLLVRAALQSALSPVLKSSITSTRAATLAQGVLQMLFVKRLSAVLTAVFFVAALGGGTGLFLRRTADAPLGAENPAPKPASQVMLVKVQTDDAGAIRQFVVSEDDDDFTMSTPRALGRYLKRARHDLGGTPELTVLIERKIRADVLESVAATCRAAGFARCQVKSADGKPFELVSADDAKVRARAEDLLKVGQNASDLSTALSILMTAQKERDASDTAVKNALDWIRKNPTASADTSATRLLAFLAGNQFPEDKLAGVWQAVEFKSNGKVSTDKKILARLEWIIAGNYLIDHQNGQWRVARIERSTKDGVSTIVIRQEGENATTLCGTYTLVGDRLKLEFPAAINSGVTKHDVSFIFQRKPAAGAPDRPR